MYRESSVIIINHGLGDRLIVTATDSTLSSFDGDEYEGIVKWETCTDTTNSGYRLILGHTKVHDYTHLINSYYNYCVIM